MKNNFEDIIGNELHFKIILLNNKVKQKIIEDYLLLILLLFF